MTGTVIFGCCASRPGVIHPGGSQRLEIDPHHVLEQQLGSDDGADDDEQVGAGRALLLGHGERVLVVLDGFRGRSGMIGETPQHP